MAELLLLAGTLLPPIAIVAGALLLMVARSTPRRVNAAAAGHSEATAA